MPFGMGGHRTMRRACIGVERVLAPAAWTPLSRTVSLGQNGLNQQVRITPVHSSDTEYALSLKTGLQRGHSSRSSCRCLVTATYVPSDREVGTWAFGNGL